jgi:hypothetical protein
MVAATLTLLVALAAASPASAAPGNGAAVVNESDCYTYDYGTACYDSRYVQNSTETPSGNLSYVLNERGSYEFTGSGPLAGCNDSTSSESRGQYLEKDGTTHEQGSRSGGEFSGECFGSLNCTFGHRFHYANGEVQFNRPLEFECTQP